MWRRSLRSPEHPRPRSSCATSRPASSAFRSTGSASARSKSWAPRHRCCPPSRKSLSGRVQALRVPQSGSMRALRGVGAAAAAGPVGAGQHWGAITSRTMNSRHAQRIAIAGRASDWRDSQRLNRIPRAGHRLRACRQAAGAAHQHSGQDRRSHRLAGYGNPAVTDLGRMSAGSAHGGPTGVREGAARRFSTLA